MPWAGVFTRPSAIPNPPGSSGSVILLPHCAGKIHDGKSVEVGKLDENTARGSVRVSLECHGAHGVVEIEFPDDSIGLQINTVADVPSKEPLTAYLLSGVT